MISIDITSLLSPYLRFSSSVSNLLAYVKSLDENQTQIDFSKVQFATRSFIEECHNTFISNSLKLADRKVKTINIPEDINYMLNVVSNTQTSHSLYGELANTTVRHFSSLNELADYQGTITL